MPKRKNQPMLFAEMEAARKDADEAAQLRFDMFEAINDAYGLNLQATTRLGCGKIWKIADQIIEIGGMPCEVPEQKRLIETKGDAFKTVGCLVTYWGQVTDKPRYTTNYGVSTKQEPDEFDDEAVNRKRVEQSERVAALDEAVRNRLAARLFMSVVDKPILYGVYQDRGPMFNSAICRMLDEEGC